MELGWLLRGGGITGDEFVAGFVAQGRLSHDAANRLATSFVRDYRDIETPRVRHADPVSPVFDPGPVFGRAVGTLRDIAVIDPRLDVDAEFWRIVEDAAVRQHRAALNAGRDTVEFSAATNGSRWRRVTDGNPCSFCAMLATRSDYLTRQSALYVTGSKRRKRPAGSTYHNKCGCTAVEVLSEWVRSDAEEAQHDLYKRAVAACQADGVPASPENVLARMREHGQGIVHDEHVPATQTGGAGGWEPPNQKGMAGPRSPDDDFGPIGPRGWVPPAARSQISFDAETVRKVLDKHGDAFDPGWGEQDVFDWVQAVIDHPNDAAPEGPNFLLYGVSNGASGVVVIVRSGPTSWFVATAYQEDLIGWTSWVERRSR